MASNKFPFLPQKTINFLNEFSPKIIITESLKIITTSFYKTIKDYFVSERIPLNKKEAIKILDLPVSFNRKEIQMKYEKFKNSTSQYLNSIIENSYKKLI